MCGKAPDLRHLASQMQHNLFGYTFSQLTEFCLQLDEPAYRAAQLAKWIYSGQVNDFDAMTNLPAGLRQKLKQTASVDRLQVIDSQQSADGTRKFLFELSDKANVESVYLPYHDRHSVCVSTQVGCAAGCHFCATGQSGFFRNLKPGEIVDQVLSIQRITGERISHVVYMGMGEPLWNLTSVLTSIKLLNQQVGISERSITVSTVGIVPKMRELAEMSPRFTLAISLHAPDDTTRAAIMPIAKRWTISEVLDAGRYYIEQTGRKVTIEYLLIEGVNSSPSQAAQLGALLRHWTGNVNIIPWNTIDSMPQFRSPSASVIAGFQSRLLSLGIATTVRQERGADIAAACGQLRRQHTVSTPPCDHGLSADGSPR